MISHQAILAVAPNGAYKQKADHPAVPLHLDEIVQAAVAAQQAGATLLHLHLRDQNLQHSLDPQQYLRTLAAIKDHTDDKLILQITSEAAGIFAPEQQIKTIRTVNPECVSIALRELIPDDAAIGQAQALFHWCAEQACRAQFILYSIDDLLTYFNYVERDVIPDAPHSVLFVLGRYHRHGQSSLSDLQPFLDSIHLLNVPWMVCAFGASEQNMVLEAAAHGGHCRIGFENNLLRSDASVSRDNTQQISDLITTADTQQIKMADISRTRTILNIR